MAQVIGLAFLVGWIAFVARKLRREEMAQGEKLGWVLAGICVACVILIGSLNAGADSVQGTLDRLKVPATNP